MLREIQIPVLSALLLGGFAAKLSQVVRSGSMYATELILGVGLILTSGRIGRGGPANAVRLGAALLFVVATCALIELRSSKPDVGCGCFGDLSRAPASGRTMARSALLALAALA